MPSRIRVQRSGNSNRRHAANTTGEPRRMLTPTLPNDWGLARPSSASSTSTARRPPSAMSSGRLSRPSSASSTSSRSTASSRPRSAPPRRPRVSTGSTSRPDTVTVREDEVHSVLEMLRHKYGRSRSLRSVYRMWDKHKTGTVNRDALNAMLQLMGLQIRPAVVDKTFEVFAGDKREFRFSDFVRVMREDGPVIVSQPEPDAYYKRAVNPHHEPAGGRKLVKMNVREVLAALRERHQHQGRLRNVFRSWDTGKKGHVTERELENVIFALGVEPNNLAKEMMQELDHDGDGVLSYAEVMGIFNSPPASPTHTKTPISPTPAGPGSPLGARAATSPKSNRAPADPQQVMNRYDPGGIGRMSREDFEMALRDLGLHVSPKQLAEVGRRCGQDGLIEYGPLFETIFEDRQGMESRPSSAGRASRRTPFSPSQLVKQVHVPTRRERTPYHDTRFLIAGPPDKRVPSSQSEETRFRPESASYGARQPSRFQAADKEKKAKQYANRLERVRANERRVETANAPFRERDEDMHERRVRTLISHRLQYYRALQNRFEFDRRRSIKEARRASTALPI